MIARGCAEIFVSKNSEPKCFASAGLGAKHIAAGSAGLLSTSIKSH